MSLTLTHVHVLQLQSHMLQALTRTWSTHATSTPRARQVSTPSEHKGMGCDKRASGECLGKCGADRDRYFGFIKKHQKGGPRRANRRAKTVVQSWGLAIHRSSGFGVRGSGFGVRGSGFGKYMYLSTLPFQGKSGFKGREGTCTWALH